MSSSSESIYETVKGSHEYKIRGYSLTKGEGTMTSGRFTAGGSDWVIEFYPDGNGKANEEHISVYVQLVNPKKEVRASFEFKLLDQSGQGKHKSSTCSKTLNTGCCSWGFGQYMKRSELETSSYLKDDCLSIHCTVGVVQTRFEESKHHVISIPPSDMSQNLKGLLESEIGYDITLQVGNESFRAHKLILAARSSVFRAQFFGVLSNPSMETLAIEECDPFAFKAMLLYLYSDELPETRELSDSDSLCTTITIMQHLLPTADRFDIARLKLMCEAKLCEEITSNTVATTLAIAKKHQCLHLKTACLNFAAKPENLGEVIKSDGDASLEQSYPSLLADLLKLVLEKRNIKNEA